MEDYRKMYVILCDAASEALDLLETGRTEQAAALLQNALLRNVLKCAHLFGEEQ